MKKLEIGGLIVVIFGVIFKILHWPFANIILIIGVQVLCMIDFLLSPLLYQNISLSEWFKDRGILQRDKFKKILFQACGFSLGLIWMGLLFNVMIWPGSQDILMYGLMAGGVSLAVVLFKFKRKDRSYLEAAVRLIPMFILGCWFYFQANTWIDYHYDFDHESRNILREMRANPGDSTLDNQFRDRLDFYFDSCNNVLPPEVSE